MYTARIVVPTIALSAGGVAAHLVSGSDNSNLPTEPVVQLQIIDVPVAKSDIGLGQSVTSENLRQSDTLSLSLRSIVDVNMVEDGTGDQDLKRGASINVVRYDVLSATATQK